jgi:hypothetical protein
LHTAGLPRLLGIGWRRLAATGTLLAGGRPFLDRRFRLAFQAQFEDLLAEDVANLDDEVFDLRQLGTPGRSPGPPEAIRQILGDSFEISLGFFYLWTPFLACHPWLPA